MNHKKNLMAAVLGLACAMPAFAANLVLNNVDAPGVGFNDLIDLVRFQFH